ncbi:conserved hypothetical protein [Pelodictyon phaeoclathratiforme BU-1]|jgi:hypothetical protein|uniref:DUF1207 domain-containing protein n=2 Tax=Pelodictyon phaeoclathratiforme TaxID=34090 RepID=B4SCQ8_PELPB|nr:conserved hypothetical protein [Pelodictyon phaeoclathratiforme BU-1]
MIFRPLTHQLFAMKSTRYLCRALFIITAVLLIPVKKGAAEPILNPTTKTLFKPLLADPSEPKIAVMPWLGDRYLQLDIGASADLYQSKNKKFAAGVDFATYSLLQRGDNFKFPVDAIDYLFGVNASWKKPISNDALPFDEFSGKVRISHISAHFEDGHYDADTHQWIQQSDWLGTIPFTYSREFVNLVVALSSPNHRIYAGYQYLYHTLPDGINPHSFQAGVELSTPGNTYLAADFKLLPIWQPSLEETKGHRGTWNVQAGRRLDDIGLKNVRVACNYFSGMSRQGMYFYRPESFSTIGVIVDL